MPVSSLCEIDTLIVHDVFGGHARRERMIWVIQVAGGRCSLPQFRRRCALLPDAARGGDAVLQGDIEVLRR
jgi:hypothetical protein